MKIDLKSIKRLYLRYSFINKSNLGYICGHYHCLRANVDAHGLQMHAVSIYFNNVDFRLNAKWFSWLENGI